MQELHVLSVRFSMLLSFLCQLFYQAYHSSTWIGLCLPLCWQSWSSPIEWRLHLPVGVTGHTCKRQALVKFTGKASIVMAAINVSFTIHAEIVLGKQNCRKQTKKMPERHTGMRLNQYYSGSQYFAAVKTQSLNWHQDTTEPCWTAETFWAIEILVLSISVL